MKWVTWQNVGVDRIGCAWLIKRFIDPEAEFVFVASDERTLPRDAEPFDIPGTRLSHHQSHASFHTIVLEHRLADPVLLRIAQMVDDRRASAQELWGRGVQLSAAICHWDV